MSCYIIKSKLSGLVLDVEGQGGHGSKVIPWDRHGRDNQLWYDDPSTGTIRSKHNHGALTTENDHLFVKEYQPGNPNQNWCRQGDAIMNRTTNKVLDVYNENKEKGAQIGPYAHNKGINQQWEFEMTGGPAPQSHSAPQSHLAHGAAAAQSPYYQGQKREFHIESEMNGKVLDICQGKKEPGTKIVMWKKHHANEKNQLFYLDGQGFIRSSLSDLAISNGAKGQGIVTAQPSGDPRSHFQFQGNRIVNQLGECLDICRKSDKDGAEIITWDSNDGKNQHWRQNFI